MLYFHLGANLQLLLVIAQHSIAVFSDYRRFLVLRTSNATICSHSMRTLAGYGPRDRENMDVPWICWDEGVQRRWKIWLISPDVALNSKTRSSLIQSDDVAGE